MKSRRLEGGRIGEPGADEGRSDARAEVGSMMTSLERLTVTNASDAVKLCVGKWDPDGTYRYHHQRYDVSPEVILEGERRKVSFLRRMLPDRVRGWIAYLGTRPVGFIEYYPIEHAPMDVEGSDIFLIHCIFVEEGATRRGVGHRLMRACIKDCRDRKGIAVIAFEGEWMPRTFFARYGFQEVDRKPTNYLTTEEPSILMFRGHTEAHAPRFMSARRLSNAPGTALRIDILNNDFCPECLERSAPVRKLAGQLPEAVDIREHDCSLRRTVCALGFHRGVAFNGEWRGFGLPPDEAAIKAFLLSRVSQGK